VRKLSFSIGLLFCCQFWCARGLERHATNTASVCIDEFTLDISGDKK